MRHLGVLGRSYTFNAFNHCKTKHPNYDLFILKAGRTQSLMIVPPKFTGSWTSIRIASGTLLKEDEGLLVLTPFVLPELERGLLQALSLK